MRMAEPEHRDPGLAIAHYTIPYAKPGFTVRLRIELPLNATGLQPFGQFQATDRGWRQEPSHSCRKPARIFGWHFQIPAKLRRCDMYARQAPGDTKR